MTNKNERRKVPELRFPEFSGEWAEKKLNNFMTFNNGINASKENYGTGKKFINVLDVLNNDFITYDNIIGKVSVSEKLEALNKVEYGDALFLRSSETRIDVGKANIYLDKEKHALFGGFIIRGKKINDYSPFFMKYLLNNQSTRKQISSKAGGSTRFNVSQSILNDIEIIIPSIDEQQKIGEFFSKLDRQIKLEEKKLALLEEQKKGYMQKIFSQELRFKDENGEEYPEWEKTKFNKFLSVPLNQEKNSAVNKDKLLSVKLNLNGITKINQDKVLNIGSTIYYQRKSGQFIYGKQNFFNGSFYIIQEEFDGYYSSGDVPSLNINNSIIDNSFFLNYIGREVYYKNQEKYSSGTGSKRIHEQTLLGFEMNLPCMSEQKKIASFLENLNKQLETMNRKIINLKKLKNNYLHLIMV